MLEAIRKATTGWIAKILLFFLVISFAVWGVADVFRGFGAGSLAKVGSTEITTNQFQQAYQNERERIGRMIGKPLTPEMARQFDIEGTVLGRLVDSAAVDTHARQLGLDLSSETIAEAVRENDAFKGSDGRFSREQFEEVLRRNGYSEGRFLQEMRRDELRRHLTGAMIENLVPPRASIDLLHAHREETRRISHFTLDRDKAVTVAKPDEAKLAEHWQQNKSSFVVPELRGAQVLILSPEAIKKRVPIDDKTVAEAYEADRDRFKIPERRHVHQLSFPDKTAAEKAQATLAKTLAAGKSIVDAAKEIGRTAEDIDLGTITAKDLIDPAIAKAAFELEKGKLSAPVTGSFTTVLLFVTEITAGKQRTLAEVTTELRDQLAAKKVTDVIEDLHKKVDDERAASRTLEEIGKKLDLDFRKVAAMDRNGLGLDGKAAIEHAELRKIAAAVFEGKLGLEAEPIEMRGGGQIWVEVAGVTPLKQKSFEESRADVEKAWLEAERRNAVVALAGKLVERANKGEALDKIATSVGAKVVVAEAAKRSSPPQGMSQRGLDRAFALAKGQAASAESATGLSRTIVLVDDIKPAPAATEEQVGALSKELAQQWQADLLASYIGALKDRLGVNVNQTAFRQVLGLDRQ